ncbi:hypothetical protein KGM_204394 [Danaus plexippus plexippus]|uniref:Uncharacterized protein n=1 Tax=Danaus plexippus plexippus TaxID=278856 RepID=A0A212FH84_DANPL|nr:hypothetical protein KGM_204394 [Danaus plexippus plexippus]
MIFHRIAIKISLLFKMRARVLLAIAVYILYNTRLMCGKPYNYPLLYRDHVYTSLSKNGEEMFFAVNIHPSCAKKRGECIKREQCRDRKILYISRVCYKRDLVCCYDDTIKRPKVGRTNCNNCSSEDYIAEYN